MRLLISADAVGGVWRWALDLARGLTEHGVATTLAVLGPSADAAQRAEAAGVAGLRLIDTGLPLDWTAPDAAALRAASDALAALADGCDATLLHAPALATGDAWVRRSAAVACHSCVGTWWDAVRGGALPPDLAWRAALTGEGLRRAAVAIAPSAAFAAAVARRYGVPAPRVVHNGRTAAAHAGARPGGAPARYLLTAGRLWDAAKGIETLDAAAARLDVPLVALGPLVAPHGEAAAPRHLHAPGRQPDAALPAWFAHAEAFVSAARYEPFGLAVLEAAQAARPLLLSDLPTFRELWAGAAAFVPVGDADAFAREARALLHDPPRRHALGDAAAARAARYTVAAMTTGTLDALRPIALARAA